MANGNSESKKQAAAKRIVVFTDKGMATVAEGGEFFGIKNGESITCEEFGKKRPSGVVCHHNPIEDRKYRRSLIADAVYRVCQ